MPTITVGCDPEFVVVDRNGSQRNASHLEYRSETYGHIGTDHGGQVGELRPKAGTPAEVTNRIKQMFSLIKTRLDSGEKIICGGGHAQRVSIGGHIHLGGLNFGNYSSPTRTFHRRAGGIQIRNLDMNNHEHKLVFMLDFFIGRRLKTVEGGKRYGSNYGCPSDIETKSHGFEYRTPPSWLTDPVITEATLAIAQKLTVMWKVKPSCFDILLTQQKRVARKKDYNFLIPDRSDPDHHYMARQVANFKKVIFSKTYKLNNPDCVELWTNEAKLRELWREEMATEVSTGRRVRRTTTSTRIDLVICQIKKVNRETDGFETESVLKVCRFGLPEIRIYPLADYTPWEFQLVRDIRLRPNTIYFSKELKKYLRIKRAAGIRTRFVETRRRVAASTGSTSVVSPMANAVFFNATGSSATIVNEIVRIFEEGARTKLKNV